MLYEIQQSFIYQYDILFIYFLGKTLGAHYAVAYVDDLTATSVVVIIIAFGAVALNKYFAIIVKVKVFCSLYIGFFLFEHSVFTFYLGFADAVFVDTYHACVAMAVGIMFAIVSCAFKSRHFFLLLRGGY